MPPTTVDHQLVRDLAAASWSHEAIAAYISCHPAYARLIAGGKIRTVADGAKTLSRFQPLQHDAKPTPPLRPTSKPMLTMRSQFLKQVRKPIGRRVLQSGYNSAKIGKEIRKGKWKYFPVFTLTLEERRTCPTTCSLLTTCYGNNMHKAIRIEAGPQLELALGFEIAELSLKYPLGFTVRLHILGDFYSVAYVRMWARLLELYPMMRVFGFTARWQDDDPIGQELIGLVDRAWDRFAIRFSGRHGPRSAITIDRPQDKPADAIVCPQQQGKTDCCSTCALCWQSERRIAFLRH